MAIHFLVFLGLIQILLPLSSSSTSYTVLNQGSSLSSPSDVLLSSPSHIFTAGFYPVGDNAYCFAIWFTRPLANKTSTVVWMANRDQPVNGRNTKLSLSNSGNLLLQDAGQLLVWTSATASDSTLQLQLHDSGDLVLRDTVTNATIWRSFDSPTNTLLPLQPLSKNTKLISSRSLTNHSTGLYTFYFDNDNVLRLLYAGAEITSVFWPPAWQTSWSAGRSTYNTSKTAMLDLYGNFSSTDNFGFQTSDVGIGPQRRLTLDADGLVRVYSLNKQVSMWEVSWQLDVSPCSIHGICGANSLCRYSHELGRSCACLPGYKIKNSRDWTEGCVPGFDQVTCNNNSDGFSVINHAEFYGFDIGYFQNYTLEECESLCLSYCDCRGFQFKYEQDTGVHSCYLKTLLFNGYQSTGFEYWMYVRLPKHMLLSPSNIGIGMLNLDCTSASMVEVERAYTLKNDYPWLKSLTWCVGGIGAVEIMCLLLFLYKTRGNSNSLREQGYFQVMTGFKRFTYAEMKKASRNFSEEIGRGGSGVVYKGMLSDNRIAAIKCLNEAGKGEEEFLAEVGLIGRLNHANLIERWGYCAEGKHRILVYEYMENGSLAENLHDSKKLDWRRRFEIALGTAKGLAYLHEECLEWVLHCDVKPQNVLLDANYQPKVADFGLSKQMKRSNVENLNVSTIRGTRGYMAPEWVYNQPITAKVDVYSYGIVVLEMVTGKSPIEMNLDSGILGNKRLENWSGSKLDETSSSSSSSISCWIEQNLDPKLGGGLESDGDRLVNLVRIALLCAQENKDARPTMTQVVDMLLGHALG